MPKSVDVDWNVLLDEYRKTDILPSALAEKHGVKFSTLRSRMNREKEKWVKESQADDNRHVATQAADVATQDATLQPAQNAEIKGKRGKGRGGAPPGNKNALGNHGGPPMGNQNAVGHGAPLFNENATQHGFFKKVLPSRLNGLVAQLMDKSPADILKEKIVIIYALVLDGIDKVYEMSKYGDVQKVKRMKSSKGDVFDDSIDEKTGAYNRVLSEVEYEHFTALDNHIKALNALPRMMSELRTYIKLYLQIVPETEKSRLEVMQMEQNLIAQKERLVLERERVEIAKASLELMEIRYGINEGEEESEDSGFMEALGIVAGGVAKNG